MSLWTAIANIFWGLLLSASSIAFVTPVKTLAQTLPGGVAQRSCQNKLVEQAPFYVSSAYLQGDKTYENLRSFNDQRLVDSYLPRRSIVSVRENAQELLKDPHALIAVEVVSPADTDFHDTKLAESASTESSSRGLRRWSAHLSRLDKAQAGTKGFLHSQALERVSDYTFILKEDSPIVKDLGLDANGVFALRPQMEMGHYLVNECCYEEHPSSTWIAPYYPQEKRCARTYSFELIDQTGTYEAPLLLDTENCEITQGLLPMQNDLGDIEEILTVLSLNKNDNRDFRLSQFEVLDSRGLVKLPLDYDDVVTLDDGSVLGVSGPYDSFHYSPDDEGNSDVYIKPYAACAFMQVLKTHSEVCRTAGCQLQFGNLYHDRSWGVHASHGSGDCIDVRPLKKEDGFAGLTHWSSNYDSEKTQKLVELLKSAGAEPIFFNDPKVYRGDPAVRRLDHHDDHIHFCFKPDNDRVRQACDKGIDSAQFE